MRELFSADELANTIPQSRGDIIVYKGDQYRGTGLVPGAWEKISSPFPSSSFAVRYTGRPQLPIRISLESQTAVILDTASDGTTQVIKAESIKGIGSFNYSEGPGSTDGVPLGDRNLLTLEFPDLEYIRDVFNPHNCPLLSSIRLPKLRVVVGGFNVAGLWLLTDLYLPKLEHVGNAGTVFSTSFQAGGSCPLLATVSAPSLKTVVGTVSPGGPATTLIDLPVLQTCMNVNLAGLTVLVNVNFPALQIATGDIRASFNPQQLTYTFPELLTVGGWVNLNNLAKLTEATFPKLAFIAGTFWLASMPLCTKISLPLLTTINGDITAGSGNGMGNLADVVLGTIGTLKKIGGNVDLSGQKLTQAKVDGILALIASLDGTNGTTAYGTGHTVSLNGGTNATPSAAGLASKATIVARGATVTNN